MGKRIISIIFSGVIFLLALPVYAANKTQIFLFLEGDSAKEHVDILRNPHIAGAQIIYSWRALEPQKGCYHFTKIDEDLNTLNALHKKLFIQRQDRSFSLQVIDVPEYIVTDKTYEGGIEQQQGDASGSTGWVAKQWVPAVRSRFQLFLNALGNTFLEYTRAAVCSGVFALVGRSFVGATLVVAL